MEARAHTRNRGAVVIDHCEAKTYGQKKTCEVIEVKQVPAASGGECGFNAVPNHEDRGKGTEQVLAHCVKEAKILREQIVDGPKDELKVVHRLGSFGAGAFACRTYGIR